MARRSLPILKQLLSKSPSSENPALLSSCFKSTIDAQNRSVTYMPRPGDGEVLRIRKMTIQSLPSIRCPCISLQSAFHFMSFESHYPLLPAISPPTRRTLSLSALISTAISTFPSSSLAAPSKSAAPDFFQLPDSSGVKALELRIGSGETPLDGDQVAVHYYGRLAAKQGWRFDTTYDHKDENGEPLPFTFVLGSGKVIAGMEAAVKSMKVGGIRRVIIPPSQGYQNTSQEPIPPNYFDRQRLFTTIFNPTRLANGEGSSLGTLIFDIELLQIKHLTNKFASTGS